jgi:hypothetical protein
LFCGGRNRHPGGESSVVDRAILIRSAFCGLDEVAAGKVVARLGDVFQPVNARQTGDRRERFVENNFAVIAVASGVLLVLDDGRKLICCIGSARTFCRNE